MSKKLLTVGTGTLLLLTGVVALILVLRSWTINIDYVPPTWRLPQDRLLADLIIASDKLSAEGDLQLHPGRFRIPVGDSSATLNVQEPTSVRLALRLRPYLPQGQQAFVLEMLDDSSITFDPPVEVRIGRSGPILIQRVDGLPGSSELAIAIRVKLLHIFASTIRGEIVPDAERFDVRSLGRLIKGVNLEGFELSLKQGATIELPRNGRFVLGDDSVLKVSQAEWQGEDLLGTIDGTLNLGLGTVFDVDNVLIQPRNATVRLHGIYRRTSSGDMIEVDPRQQLSQVEISDATVNIDGTTAMVVRAFRTESSELKWQRSLHGQSFSLRATASIELQLDHVPIPSGSISCSALQIPSLSLDVFASAYSDDIFTVEIRGARSREWQVTFESGGGQYRIAGGSAQVADLNISKMRDIRISLPTASMQVAQFAVATRGLNLSGTLGRQSKLQFTGDEFEVVLFPKESGRPVTGNLEISGRLQSISVLAGRRRVAVEDTKAHVNLEFGDQARMSGTADVRVTAAAFRNALSDVLKVERGFEFEGLKITNMSLSGGDVAAELQFDAHGNTGVAAMSINGSVLSARLRGEDLDKERFDATVQLDGLTAIYDLAHGEAEVSTSVTVKSASRPLIFTQGWTIFINTRERVWVRLEPFDIAAQCRLKVQHSSGGRITMKVLSVDAEPRRVLGLRMLRMPQQLQLRATTRHSGAGGRASFRPFDDPRIVVNMRWGPVRWNRSEDNPIYEAVQSIVGKDIVLRN